MSLVGPSYAWSNRRAAIQRSVNWMLRQIEPGNEKSPAILEQCPGLSLLAAPGAEIRGGWWTGSRGFVVAGSTLYEVSASWALNARGTLSTSSGPVDMAQGLRHLVIVDGPYGYSLTLASNAFAQITDPDFGGADRVSFLDGKFQFTRTGSQRFQWTAGIDDAANFDALDFASAESAPDNIVAHVVNFRELLFLGEFGLEAWNPYPSGDKVYQRNNGANMEVGGIACHSFQRIDNGVIWISQDRNGSGMVHMAYDYRPQRVSNFAVEEALKTSSNLSAARIVTFQDRGQTFAAVNAPGLKTTWVLDISNKHWHERADWDAASGEFKPWRPLAHVHMHGVNVMGDAAGNLYRLDNASNKYGDDVIHRLRSTPHTATPAMSRLFFDSLRLDVNVGETPSGVNPQIEMRYSNDGGFNWGDWQPRSLGRIGEFSSVVMWRRLGYARDRVWELRCSSDCKAALLGAAVQEGAK